jgi:hypothetical protein
MTSHLEATAMAMLTSGSSFQEASEKSGVPLERLMTLWREREQSKKSNRQQS